MRSFSFRLEQVLRWRETQVTLQESRVAAASAKLAEIRSLIEAGRADLAGARIDGSADGSALQAYAGFRQRTEARIRELDGQAVAAQRALAIEMDRLVDANRKMKLIDNLKQRARTAWTSEFERELSAFADEAFVNRYNR
jgi:flagellar export protein FliJ